MSIASGQLEVTTTSGTITLAALAPGPSSVTFSNGGTALIYLGFTSPAGTVTTTSGMPIPSGSVFTFATLAGDPGWTAKAVTAAGSATAGYLVSTSYGLPQPGQQ